MVAVLTCQEDPAGRSAEQIAAEASSTFNGYPRDPGGATWPATNAAMSPDGSSTKRPGMG